MRQPVGKSCSSLAVGPASSGMTHLLNILCDGVLIYASVTRGGLGVARGLTYVTRKVS